MRLMQSVIQARQMIETPKGHQASQSSPSGLVKGHLSALCDRKQVLADWEQTFGCRPPQLELQGSDAYLKKQFKACSEGEIGWFLAKQIVSALPEPEERPLKVRRKVTVDGWEKEEEEEERREPITRRQLERMHMVFRNTLLMCISAFPQFKQFDVTKDDLDEWYDWFWGRDISC